MEGFICKDPTIWFLASGNAAAGGFPALNTRKWRRTRSQSRLYTCNEATGIISSRRPNLHSHPFRSAPIQLPRPLPTVSSAQPSLPRQPPIYFLRYLFDSSSHRLLAVDHITGQAPDAPLSIYGSIPLSRGAIAVPFASPFFDSRLSYPHLLARFFIQKTEAYLLQSEALKVHQFSLDLCIRCSVFRLLFHLAALSWFCYKLHLESIVDRNASDMHVINAKIVAFSRFYRKIWFKDL